MPDEKPISEVRPHDDPPTLQVPNAQLRDKRKLPEGVVPKQAQGYMVAGLAVLILMAVMFSKNHPRPATKAPPATAGSASTDVNPTQDSGAGAGPQRPATAGGCARTGRGFVAFDQRNDHDESFAVGRFDSCFAVTSACSRSTCGASSRPYRRCGKGNGVQVPFCLQPRRSRCWRSAPIGHWRRCFGVRCGSSRELAAGCCRADHPGKQAGARSLTSILPTVSLSSSSRAPPSTRFW